MVAHAPGHPGRTHQRDRLVESFEGGQVVCRQLGVGAGQGAVEGAKQPQQGVVGLAARRRELLHRGGDLCPCAGCAGQDPGLAVQHQSATVPVAGPLQQGVDRRLLGLPAAQHGPHPSRGPRAQTGDLADSSRPGHGAGTGDFADCNGAGTLYPQDARQIPHPRIARSADENGRPGPPAGAADQHAPPPRLRRFRPWLAPPRPADPGPTG